MSRRAWFHVLAVVAACLLALLLVSLHRATGQTLPRGEDPVSRGGALARAWCMTCHTVGPVRGNAADLNFEAIANKHSTTSLSLHAFLQTSHRAMPNIILEGNDLDDIVAYILSLKRE